MNVRSRCSFYFFFNIPATTEIYTLPLPDALPISPDRRCHGGPLREDPVLLTPRRRTPCLPRLARSRRDPAGGRRASGRGRGDRKSTRLKSSHANISYAVFCLKKKKTNSPRLATST